METCHVIPETQKLKPLSPLIAEKARNGGFNLSDFWKEDYKDLRSYSLAEIIEACEELVNNRQIKQREDGVYIPAI